MGAAGLNLALATDKPAFDLLLVGHVACTLVGFGALATSGVQASRLLRCGTAGPGPTLLAYFAPGVNWAGRAVYGVPLFGFALLADSGGHLRLGQGWAVAGLALWGLAAVLAEGFLWPAERRIQSVLAAQRHAERAPMSVPVRRDCRVVGCSGACLAVIFVVATVLMVARPG